MSGAGLIQFILLLVVLALTAPPLGRYMAAVYEGRAPGDRFFVPVERLIYRLLRVNPQREQRWNVYAIALLGFSMVSFLAVYGLQRFQDSLPFNPTNMPAVAPLGAFNVAVSFMTNTNWQWYSPELTMGHLTQMLGLAVQNFVSAAAGMAVVVAIIRGISRRGRRTLGNFWVDLTRTTLRILLPLSFVIAMALSLGGVVQNLRGHTEATPIDAVDQPADSRAARPPARSPSSNSAPTAADSSTPTPPTRSRTARRSPTSSRCGRSSSSPWPSSSRTAC